MDNFANDTSLNTTLWTTWSSLLNSIASYGEGGMLGNTLVAPILGFGPNGMQMSGANANLEFTGIQSLEAFSPPFILNTTVTGTIANANPFELFLSNSNWTSKLAIFGNINSANCGYYGIWANAVDGDKLYGSPAVGVPYTIQVAVDATGYLTVSLISNGTTLAQQNGTGFTGPFYVILGQGEGSFLCSPGTANVAVWQNVCLASGASIPPLILIQPQSEIVGVGDTPTFYVNANGTLPLFYQWQSNGVNIPNATNGSFTINDAETNDGGNFAVIVSNAFGTAISSTATLQVTNATANAGALTVTLLPSRCGVWRCAVAG